MLLRAALLASVFSAFILAAEPPAAPVFSGKAFPDQDKSLSQLTQQTLDRRLRAAVTGKQLPMATNPTNMPYHGFVLPSQRIPSLGSVALSRTPAFCAIPLLEAKAPAATDSMLKVAGQATFDRIGKPYPIPACKNQ
jgi:hypothetical protein